MLLPHIIAQALYKDAPLIPDVVWPIFIGSAVTIAGVLVTNWENSRRHARQLSHERAMKEEDRMLALRKEDYAQFMKACSEMESTMRSLPEMDMSEFKLLERNIAQSLAQAELNCSNDSGIDLKLFKYQWEDAFIDIDEKLNEARKWHQTWQINAKKHESLKAELEEMEMINRGDMFLFNSPAYIDLRNRLHVASVDEHKSKKQFLEAKLEFLQLLRPAFSNVEKTKADLKANFRKDLGIR